MTRPHAAELRGNLDARALCRGLAQRLRVLVQLLAVLVLLAHRGCSRTYSYIRSTATFLHTGIRHGDTPDTIRTGVSLGARSALPALTVRNLLSSGRRLCRAWLALVLHTSTYCTSTSIHALSTESTRYADALSGGNRSISCKPTTIPCMSFWVSARQTHSCHPKRLTHAPPRLIVCLQPPVSLSLALLGPAVRCRQ